MSRRALLAGGAVALLAGCGDEDEAAAPRPADVLLRSLAAERRLAAAAPRKVARRARERAQRLAAAVSEQGGRPHDAPAAAARGDAVPAARAALVAHVDSLPQLSGDLRALAGELIVGAAADLAVLTGEAESFPGTPS
ncbi:MAG TPA: hypothetical protein VFP78_13815 [Solirubrobacteraceae bacterium]|nr:hypothetical protein [Solirubrobacteraceae bacterium]